MMARIIDLTHQRPRQARGGAARLRAII